MSDLSVIILAAGQGTRMKSALPKVLHELGAKPMLEHVVDTAMGLNASSCFVVYGHGGELVPKQLSHLPVQWVLQAEQLGTGHAVDQATPHIQNADTVLVLYGDVPLITPKTLSELIKNVSDEQMSLLTATLPNPSGYGRIVRDVSGQVQSIVEQKDATVEQLQIKEINTGMLAVKGDLLKRWLKRLENNNAQGEYYLTDIIAMAVKEGVTVRTCKAATLYEIEGVNNKLQLAELERVYQRQQADRLMLEGITLKDPARFDLRGQLSAGQDVVIDVDVVIEGKVTLGNNVSIGPFCQLRDCHIGNNVTVLSHCNLEGSTIGNDCSIGPFARLRPETELADKAKIGNFVEVKKSQLGPGSKVNHLSYIGDTTMGSNVNIGAGTITCNYDGANKHQTVIEDNAFIGSDTQLVAPVTIGEGATVGAGSTITHDAPPKQLTLSRAQQKSHKGWKRPSKNK
ncbi:MAG: bifunctional UDP-N-acetylglucosamine diphosphorylase/glucosamine-1-phosphate N-acetyltransferase GlmU [Gammaproteobacteria bacterium]|nr:bifunctional UDP-N-acetylglucosamine diphosphorylase/glucosamine-1-phosphate N-acetyltransferase GlmU [Gammaproteobacteria bacterium]MDH5800221.1 bifunctional UDP-N-acetylglucosamine diphosphorylase/glucosamine-1-phosphate N-acetyltransferase GlmU [Gammaproteobacteria bacterium]